MYYTLRYRLLLTIMILMSAMSPGLNRLNAQTEKYIQTLSGTIKKGDSCVVTDDKFHDAEKWATIEQHVAVYNLLTFEIRYDTTAFYFNRNFTCTLQVDIEYEKADRTKQQLKNISLNVSYDTSPGSTYQGIAYYKFRDAHHVKITVNKISSAQWGNKLPAVFRIKNEIFIDRLYRLHADNPITQLLMHRKDAAVNAKKGNAVSGNASGYRGDTPGQQEMIGWTSGDPSYPEYDFEWTFYDDNSLAGFSIANGSFTFSDDALTDIFKNNSTRVTVGLPFYQLNLVYNKGWVFHRVRGVRYDEVTGERTEGAWNYSGQYNYKGSLYGLLRSNGHEALLNWQYRSDFAEQGKRKEVIAYFDGSLRNRQSVTLGNDNAGSSTIVQEQIFDALGRPAVNVLPAPTMETSIHYFHAFNKSAATDAPYQYTDFESNGNCNTMPAAMQAGAGAALYYSPANPRKGDNSREYYFTKYLPDAQGYPFAVSTFTPDNTGRLRMQGSVGSTFQPGAALAADDHTTRYFYGKPQQEELDRLFGNEAGNASHYFKNMAIDANGQTSVSYLNASGKIIATALAGKNAANLHALPSNQSETTNTVTTLTDRDNIVRDATDLSLTYYGTFLAAAAGNLTLKYAFTPLSLQIFYGVQNEKICADCYYDLLINVTDNCGNTLQSVKKEAIFSEQTACDPTPTKQEGELPVKIEQPGEYNITYQLKLSRKAIEYYTNRYLVQDLSLQKEVDFQRDYLHKVDLAGCFNNCETCLTDLGSEETFIKSLSVSLEQQSNIALNASDTSWMKDLYSQLLSECMLLQEGCGKTELPCQEQTLQLREDLIPGGQYMLYDAATNKFIERDINVLLKNANAITASITINGNTKPFNQFDESDILLHWQDDWADILLPFHPENTNNCLIAGCARNAESDLFDTRFLNTGDALLAHSRGYWFADDYASVVNNDPYFKAGEGALKKDAFLQALQLYKSTGLDIMSLVRWNVYCQLSNNGAAYPLQLMACPRTINCNREQDEWSLFKTLYYSAKQEIKNKNNSCSSNELFMDPTDVLTTITDQPAHITANCSTASLFEIANNKGTVTVQYKGSEPLEQDITIQFFGVNNNNQLAPEGTGALVFPAGTVSDAIRTTLGKPELTYVINFARCNPYRPYYTKTRRNYNGVSLTAVINQLQNSPKDELNAAANASMVQECNENCEQQAAVWMQKLTGCMLDVNGIEYNEVMDGLTAVCKSSCQLNVQDHPFGASNTSIATALGDKSFRDVLVRVLGQQRFSAFCNDLLLDFPPPMETKPLYANEWVRTLSSCAYNKLQAWHAAYYSTTGYDGFALYIRKNVDPDFGLTDAEIVSLVNAFENNCVTPNPVLLPASLSCTVAQPVTCLTCVALVQAQINFETAYSYVPPGSAQYYALLANYLNRIYAFNLSSVDTYNALEHCAIRGTAAGTDTIDCEVLTRAVYHFEQLKPNYFTNPNNRLNADSLYRVHIVLWLNTALNRQLDFDVYRGLAERCNIVFHYPGKPLQCYTADTVADCAPQFITCCEPFAALQNFQHVFPDSADARLLALYFSLQRTEWCTPVNFPAIDYLLPYDSIVSYFQNFKLASGYTITVGFDSMIHYSISNTGTCNATALNFKQAAMTDALYVVCRKPLQPLFPIDGNSCISEQISTALFNAHSDYLEYKEKLKRDYRDAYYNKCLSITPQLTATAVYEQQPEYHYTLYYYDQSGTLVKTIPPAGVQPVDEQPDGASRMKRIKNFRLADKDYCYEYGDAPFMNGSASITITDNAALHQNQADFTIEAFVNFSSLSGTQTILAKQSVNAADNTIDGYKLYLQNGRLQVDFAAHGQEWWIQTLNKLVPYPWPAPYATQPPVIIPTKVQVPVLRSLYRSLTAQITSDISELINAGQWVAISIEGTTDRNDPIHIYINGSLVNSSLVDNKYNYTPAASPAITSAEIAAGTIEWRFTFNSTAVPLSINNTVAADLVIGAAGDGLLGSIKQVRLYQRTLPAAEIRNNAFNSCLIPQTEAGLVLWLPLHKEETAGSCLDRINQVATNNHNTVFSNAFQPVYPVHRLPTHYYYNSLAGITRQASPDAGEINFYYDLPGRLIASQNAEQRIAGSGNNNGSYSYTKYDPLGRIIEAGEKSGAAAMTNAIAFTNAAIKNSLLSNWMASGNDANMIQTIYDEPDKTIVPNKAITANQEVYTTSRKRVVAMVYRNKESAAMDYNNATHYQYDISGNVKRLWQEHRQSVTGEPVNLLKTLEYDYDLLSGKVNEVRYQPGKGDQFVYKYEYDPENRLLQAFSGRDKNTLQQDAGYRYYGHGPLARMETGDATTGRIVQGSDYAYTLQGWLKGVNGVQLSPDRSPGAADAGGDGVPLTAGGIHATAGADALAYTLGYYHNDYVPIGASAAAAFDIAYHSPASASAEPTGKELFNGNIAYSVYDIAGITEGRPLGYTYGYDQLNRLSERRAHTFYTAAAGGWNNGMALPDHKESFTYDANGNILGLFRNGTREGERPLAMDQLFYHYYYYTKNNTRQTYQPGKPVPADAWMLTNQLAHISDAVPAANYPSAIDPDEQDIDDQTTGNYAYNRIGNLVSDKAGGILNIGWTVYGKISRIDKADGTSVIYDYDAAGNRIQKEIISGKAKTISYYVRDVIGNIIAVYGWQGRPDAILQITTAGNGVKAQTWNEQHLYGSSRLGMWKPGITVPDKLDLIAGAVQIGSKFFELTNHLGNVLAVVSDKKLAVPSVNNPVLTDHYTAELISASDYTSFGMRMVGRQYNVTAASYHYGFNGKENDNEAEGEGNQQDYGMRIYDPRVGRFLSVDPVTSDYPMLSPYQFASNSPVSGIDLDGLEYSPAGKLGILAIDNTAVQLYPNHPTVIEQQRADAPMVLLSHQMAHIHPQPSFLSVQWKPANAFEQVRHEINKEDWYDRDGYKADGTAKPLTKLAGNKTWNSFANNLALPFFDIASYTGGEGEIQALIKGASKLATREEIAGLVDALFSSTKAVKELDAKAVIGYRGSLATGIKYKTGGPFNPHDFDVDAFIVSDKMARQFGNNVSFRNGRALDGLERISEKLEHVFRQVPGYRTELNKPFTFRIYNTKEFKSMVKPNGYKTF